MADKAPRESSTLNLNEAVPTKPAAGAKTSASRLPATTRSPADTALRGLPKYRMPCAAVGSATTLTAASVSPASVNGKSAVPRARSVPVCVVLTTSEEFGGALGVAETAANGPSKLCTVPPPPEFGSAPRFTARTLISYSCPFVNPVTVYCLASPTFTTAVGVSPEAPQRTS